MFADTRVRVSWAIGVIFGVVSSLLAYDATAGVPDESGEAFEHRFIAGAGGAIEAEFSGGNMHGGSSIFLEWEAIDQWLELELGVSALAADGGVEVPIDLLFKKPFRLSRRIELMCGLGPELISYRGTANDGEFFGLEVAADFMFWPSRRVGLWIEPAYELTFRSGTEHSLASTGGVIFGW